MQNLFGFVLIAIWLVSCFGIVKTAVERDQSDSTTTILYVAFIALFFLGGTGIYVMITPG